MILSGDAGVISGLTVRARLAISGQVGSAHSVGIIARQGQYRAFGIVLWWAMDGIPS